MKGSKFIILNYVPKIYVEVHKTPFSHSVLSYAAHEGQHPTFQLRKQIDIM